MPDPSDPFDLTGLDQKQRHRVRQVIDRPNLTRAKRRELVTAMVDGFRTPSDLEQRATQARTDDERARHLRGYSTAVRTGKAKPPVVLLAPKAPPRYFLGPCLRCSAEMWVHTAKPRVPICDGCQR